MTPIWQVASGFNVGPLQEQLDAAPELWNEHRERTQAYAHSKVSDVWVRYRDFAEFDGDMAAFNEPHASAWYPGVTKIPSAWSLARKVKRLAGAETLGGVLITRIPPGESVKPHIDGGWHAGHYRKFGVQVKGDQRQAFCFEGAELRANDGDVYEFRNDVLHWVTNDSDRERITLIVCVR